MKVFHVLFGLVFACVFIFGGVQIALETAVPTYQSWQQMKPWQSTAATIGHVSGSENETQATYHYQIDGISYQNDRVYLASFKDNIGDYHQQLFHRLQQIKNRKQTVTIWFDPENPQNSVIDREMRWGLFTLMTGFCSIFILIGLVVCYASIKTDKSKKLVVKPSIWQLRREWKQNSSSQSFVDFCTQKAKTFNQHSEQHLAYSNIHEQPWLQRKQWRNNGQIRSNAKKSMWAMWLFAIFWIGLSSPVLFVLEEELQNKNYPALLALLFPLVGIFLLKQAWKLTKEWSHFGVIALEMDPFPGALGGHVGGKFFVKNIQKFNGQYKVSLQCVHSYISGHGKSRSRRESIKWHEHGLAKTELAGNGMALKFRFNVPGNLPESAVTRGNEYDLWRLTLSSEDRVIKLERNYDIPVFNTGVESKYIQHDISTQVTEVREDKALETQAAINSGNFSNTALDRALKYRLDRGRHEFYFPMFRNKMLSIFALVFAGGFGFATYSINQDFTEGGLMNLAMLIFSIPFALVTLFASIAVIYLPFNNLTTVIEGRTMTVMRRLFFIPVKYNKLNSAEIKKIEIKSTGSTGSGSEQVKHFKLIAHDSKYKKVTLAEGIDGEGLAQQFKDFICKQLWLKC